MSGPAFNGRIGHVTVYNRELSPDEIQRIYDSGGLSVTRCPECEKDHVPGHHPDNGCRTGVVDNVMES